MLPSYRTMKYKSPIWGSISDVDSSFFMTYIFKTLKMYICDDFKALKMRCVTHLRP